MPDSQGITPPESERKSRSRESASTGVHETAFGLLAERLASGRVLDLPAGSGAFTRRLVAGGYNTAAGDIEEHPALPDEAEFHPANMDEPLAFPDAAFDAVVSIEGIEHIRRPFDFVAECRRILRGGGLLLITTPNISSLRSRWRWFLTGFHNKCKTPLDETRPAPRHHINMVSFPEMRYLLHTQGFEIETVETNRVKGASWLHLPWVPLVYLASWAAFRRGIKNPEHGRVTHEVRRQMMSRAILFGETMIVVARATK